MNRTPPNRAAWCEVLDIAAEDRILVFSDQPDAPRRRLERMGATVGAGPTTGGSDRWDLVVVDRPRSLDCLAGAWLRVRTGGRLVVVTDNQRSPLRWLDERSGRAGGPTIASVKAIRATLAELGAAHAEVFGLLRGSSSSPTVFRTDLPAVTRAVLASAAANSGSRRRMALSALTTLAVRGWATALLPAWMIVASDHPRSTGPTTPTGRIGVELNAQGVVVLGPGPDGVEKFYRDPAALAASVEALETLAAVRFTAAPRIVDRPSPTRLRLEWVPGTDIDANNLPVDELESWLRRAGTLLGELQRRTSRHDGTVLVHGDLWLGAMVADGDRIAAIIDWDDSHWGDPETDMRTLLAVARERAGFTPRERGRLIDAAYDGHAEAGGPERARSKTER